MNNGNVEVLVRDSWAASCPPRIVNVDRLAISSNTLDRIMNDDIKCPICLGPIDRTSTTTTCLHRFCTSCLETSLRRDKGNKEHHDCPSCRATLTSRRSSRLDSRYDALIHIFSSMGTKHTPEFDLRSYQQVHDEKVGELRQKQRQFASTRPPMTHNHSSSTSSSKPKVQSRSRQKVEPVGPRVCLALLPCQEVCSILSC
jgi:hypothetical protein